MRLAVIGRCIDKSSIGNSNLYRIVDIDSLEIKDIPCDKIYQAYYNKGISVKGLQVTRRGVYLASKSLIKNIDKLEDIRSKHNKVYVYIKDTDKNSVFITCNKSIINIPKEKLSNFIKSNIVIPLNYTGTNINSDNLIANRQNRKITLFAVGVRRLYNNINNKSLGYKIYDSERDESYYIDTDKLKSRIAYGDKIFPLILTQGTIKLDNHTFKGCRLPLINKDLIAIDDSNSLLYSIIGVYDNTIKIINCNDDIIELDIAKYKEYKILGVNSIEDIQRIGNKINNNKCISINTYKQSLYNWCISNGEYGKSLLNEYIDNEDIREVMASSKVKIMWRCSENHTYALEPYRRTSKFRRGCPVCSRMSSGTSVPEKFYLFLLRQVFDYVEHRKIIDNTEYDIYIPSIKTAIEYNSDYWHLEREDKDSHKQDVAIENDIRLIVISAIRGVRKTYRINNDIITKPEQSLEDFKDTARELFGILRISLTSVSLEDAYNEAFKHRGKNSLNINKSMKTLYKNTVALMFCDKEEAEYLTPGSNKEVRVKCPICTNEWTTRPNTLTHKNIRGSYERKEDTSITCKFCKHTVADMIKHVEN